MSLISWIRYQCESPQTRARRDGEAALEQAWQEFWTKTFSEGLTGRVHTCDQARSSGRGPNDQSAPSDSFDKRLGS